MVLNEVRVVHGMSEYSLEPEGDAAIDEDDRDGCAELSHRDQDADW